MVNQYKICYTAKWPDGKLLDPKRPFMNAYVLASTKTEALQKFRNEFPMLKLTIMSDPVMSEECDDEDNDM